MGPAVSQKTADHSAFYIGRRMDARSQPSNVFPLLDFISSSPTVFCLT